MAIASKSSTRCGGQLDDLDLAVLQIQIVLTPLGGAVVAGTGGIRKMRFRPLSWNIGKSGAVRVGMSPV
jgi:hypothetical protein